MFGRKTAEVEAPTQSVPQAAKPKVAAPKPGGKQAAPPAPAGLAKKGQGGAPLR